MQRHHFQMLAVFLVSLAGVLMLGMLWGAVMGMVTALLLAPWSNRDLRQWTKRQFWGLFADGAADCKVRSEAEAAAWTPVARAIHYAMDVENLDVSIEVKSRTLSDQDIRQLVELDKEAARAGVHLEINHNKSRNEAAVDTALRHRQARKITLQKQV